METVEPLDDGIGGFADLVRNRDLVGLTPVTEIDPQDDAIGWAPVETFILSTRRSGDGLDFTRHPIETESYDTTCPLDPGRRHQHAQRREHSGVRGITTREIPSRRAREVAWSPPAPPKATNAASRGSAPCSTDTARIARSMWASTTSRIPVASPVASKPS